MADTDHAALVEATGLAISLIGALLEGHAVLPKGEFSRHIANLAVVTGEIDAAPGDILAQWAAIAAQVKSPPAH